MFRRKKRKETEFIPARQEIRESSRITLKDLLGGNVLSKEVVTRQIPFMLFVTTAILLYIFNQYRGESIMKQITQLEKQIKELRTEAVSTAFELQEISKESEVYRMVSDHGLPIQEAKTPPIKIVMEE